MSSSGSILRMAQTSDDLSPEVRAILRAHLERERAALLRRADQPRTVDAVVDPMDASAQTAVDLERDLDTVLDERTRQALGDVSDAFERLEDGTFGRCDDCGAQIGQARLLALPHARRCLSCQDQAEHRRH